MWWKRRQLLDRAARARHDLHPVADRTAALGAGSILCLACIRNEAGRLPFFLAHHRRLGVGHFLIVDNGSTDATRALLAAEPDVSLWSAAGSYKAARFGMDWLNALLGRYGTGRWCLTLDADEILVYPHWPDRPLPDLARRLERTGRAGMGALMLDLFPEGRIGAGAADAGADPLRALPFFDPGPWRARRQMPMQNLHLQGGTRDRAFFAAEPQRAPTLNKLPLIRWQSGFAYANSTHALLPPRLNLLYHGPGGADLSGVLLHTKFLPTAVARAAEEKARGEHFSNGRVYDGYYDAVAADPVLHHPGAARLQDWQQLEALGLMARGSWD